MRFCYCSFWPITMNRTGNTTACPLAWAVLAWHQRRSSTSPRNSSGVFLMHSLRRYTKQLRSNDDISVYDLSISSFFTVIVHIFKHFAFVQILNLGLSWAKNHWNILACWPLFVTESKIKYLHLVCLKGSLSLCSLSLYPCLLFIAWDSTAVLHTLQSLFFYNVSCRNTMQSFSKWLWRVWVL